MPDILISQFDRKYGQPIETFRKVNNLANRDAIPSGIRWEGMLVYVVSDQNTYQLTGGVDNSFWINYGGYTDIFVVNNLDSFLTTAALSANQGRELNNKFANYQLLSEKGAANGYAPLGADSKISATYLPAYVDDVVEYANLAAFPATGEAGKLYVALDTNFIYRWSGSTYIQIGGGGAGAVDSVFGRVGAIAAQVGDYSSFYVNKTGDSMTGVLTVDANVNVTSGFLTAKAPGNTWRTLLGNSGTARNYLVGGSSVDDVSTLDTYIRIRSIADGDLTFQQNSLAHKIYHEGNSDFVNRAGDTMTGNLTVPILLANGSANAIRILGTGVGNANVGYMSIYESDGITRQGYFGFPSGSNGHLYMLNDVSGQNIFLSGTGGNNGLNFYDGASTRTVWHSGNDGVGSGLDAGLFNGLAESSSGNRWNVYTPVSSSGVMEVGKYLDFHNTDASTSDNDGRLTLTAANAWTFGGQLTASTGMSIGSGMYETYASDARVKQAVWNSTTYGVGMGNSYTYGGLSGYAMTFQMNETAGRGWWWGQSAQTNAQGAMSLTNDGRLTVGAYMRLGYGASDVTTPGTTYRLQVNGQIQASDYKLSSDKRLKKNIKQLEPKEIKTRWISFTRKEDNTKGLGVTAQELEKERPDLVTTDESGYKAVSYIGLLIEKIAYLESIVLKK